jgi:hypothetical protein
MIKKGVKRGILIFSFIVLIAALYMFFSQPDTRPDDVNSALDDVLTNVSIVKNASQPSNIYLNATSEVPLGGVFAAQITYISSQNNSVIQAIDTSTGREWKWIIEEKTGKIGIMYPVNSSGAFKAWIENETKAEEVTYSLIQDEPDIDPFLVETWALKHTEFSENLKPGDKATLSVGDANKSFTLTITDEGFNVSEGVQETDVIFVIYRKEDLMEFVTTEDLGATIRSMIGQKKLAVQLKTGDLYKLSRFVNFASSIGVI